jgi:septum formation topological specificity factor MinE
MFTSSQLKQLSDRGISQEQAVRQLDIFKKGITPVKLVKPAIPDDGIEVFDEKLIDYYVNRFQNEKEGISIVKFVPASGAASRMFKQLFEAKDEFEKNTETPSAVLQKIPELDIFFKDLKNYPFYDDLKALCKSNGTDPESLLKSGKYAEILNFLLSGSGLAYGELPKGLLMFHKYTQESRTAFEEHFEEAAYYIVNKSKHAKLHFTVSPEHRKLFESLSLKLIKKYLEKHKVTFEVEFSVQKPSTDTLAVDMENKPFMMEGDKLLFRPGGHGALLDNMQDINEKIVFVGNIDNVAPDRTKTLRVRYKELLAGILIERVQRIHGLLNNLKKAYSQQLKKEVLEFIQNYISASTVLQLSDINDNEFVTHAILILNRPLRVCGMVKNVGEPGGGPFWISDKSGIISKQIVESSQVNLSDPEQDKIFRNATHFNPVDMVCFTYNYKGKKFNLEEFRDPDMAFIAVKSQGGSSLKALELPGLWNGSMAGWLTFFVDVPIETFSPVKTIFDLRRQEHISII